MHQHMCNQMNLEFKTSRYLCSIVTLKVAITTRIRLCSCMALTRPVEEEMVRMILYSFYTSNQTGSQATSFHEYLEPDLRYVGHMSPMVYRVCGFSIATRTSIGNRINLIPHVDTFVCISPRYPILPLLQANRLLQILQFPRTFRAYCSRPFIRLLTKHERA